MVFKKLGVVLQAASTGGWRFASQLCLALKSSFPELELVTYLGNQVLSDFASDTPAERLRAAGIVVKPFASIGSSKKRSGLRALAAAFRQIRLRRMHKNQRQELNKHDVVFYAWPYNMDYPSLTCPTAFLPHDFFYLHFAGGFQDSNHIAQEFRKQHEPWMQNAYPVVSTKFIASELLKAFPDVCYPPQVIHLANLSSMQSLSPSEACDVVQSLGIQNDYLLCLNNASYHKNLGQVLAGFHYVQSAYPTLQLVVCGHGTGGVSGRANTPLYIDRFDPNPNVVGLGLRSDREVTALIQNSKAVINASLYEAGNGSGLDAWHLGTPVAMSAIPPFLEQCDVLGVKAVTFNPRCCYEIRDALLSILDNPDKAKAAAIESKSAIHAYSWEQVAQRYHDFFERVIADSTRSS